LFVSHSEAYVIVLGVGHREGSFFMYTAPKNKTMHILMSVVSSGPNCTLYQRAYAQHKKRPEE